MQELQHNTENCNDCLENESKMSACIESGRQVMSVTASRWWYITREGLRP